MNSSILKKEFLELRQSINVITPAQTLSELFSQPEEKTLPTPPTRIGVQRGSTLMKALSDRIPGLSTKMSNRTPRFEQKSVRTNGNGLDGLKAGRREEIIKIIKDNSNGSTEGLTITDIKSKAQGPLASCGEKTLQRELVSMVGEGVLNKVGSKRWSRYFLAR